MELINEIPGALMKQNHGFGSKEILKKNWEGT